MKKFLLLVILLAGGGAAAWFFLLTPEKRACAKMQELCGGSVDPKAFDQCQEGFAKVKKAAPEQFGKMAQCITEANSCGEVAGCQMGGMLNIGVEMGKGFLDGLGKSMAGDNHK